jgi:hypothetical protein
MLSGCDIIILSPLAFEQRHPYNQLWKRKITEIRTSDGEIFLKNLHVIDKILSSHIYLAHRGTQLQDGVTVGSHL